MIKFFRKIRQKMLTENKFSKYLLYAIGEIILVVIGILIALQINNWNEEQKENIALKQNLLIIKGNIESDLVLLDSLKTVREKLIPNYKKEQLTFFNNNFNPQTTMEAARCFDAISFRANTSGFEALEKSPYLSLINGSTIHKLLLEQKTAIETVLITENETNNTIDDLEARMSYITDLNIGYASLSMGEDELKKANITMLEIVKFLNEMHGSILYRNIIAKASIRDLTIIPQYSALIQINKDVIAEIDKITKD
ncbi:DUF6090 family protein [uncultured Algibacter sp.]|uniref:DUF6090 family protein n=1 Tax=uncultured Algibacter sp. TaxID=298659 RepID=UPI00261A07B0|nr:DUF6090 family protein [uncultured Algibacter sp.]